jgi:hypothetical protein
MNKSTAKHKAQKSQPVGHRGSGGVKAGIPEPKHVREWVSAAEKNYHRCENYWKSVAPFAEKRVRGVQWHIVSFAWYRLQQAHADLKSAVEKLRDVGCQQPAAELPTLPPKPEYARIPEISPGELTATALLLATATLNKQERTPEKIAEKCFPAAHGLLIEAADFLEDRKVQPVKEFIRADGVPFKAITDSNDKNSEALKLLPGITTEEGLVKLIRRFYDSHGARIPDGLGKEKVLPDLTGAKYIARKSLPPSVLAEIRAWNHAEKSARGNRNG